MSRKIEVKRVYDPATKSDGERILVDRLWPRGISKEKAKVDIWAKDLTPSRELISWFHSDKPGRFKEFKSKYRSELSKNKTFIKELPKASKFTLVTAVKDIEHSHIPVLESFLARNLR